MVFMSERIIAIASDHAGIDLKQVMKEEIETLGYEAMDLGTHSSSPSVDYPDYAQAMAEWLKKNPRGKGVLICGSGIGVSIAANRYRHVRAAAVSEGLSAALARRHNDANVLCLGARVIGVETAKFCLGQFLGAEFEGGRHVKRVEKMS